MTPRIAIAALAVCMAFALRADGDSGDALKSPDNAATATKAFAGPSDTLDRDGWHSEGGYYCYARRDGVGLRTDEISALLKDFEIPEHISYVAVTVSAAATTAVNKELQLSLRLRDDLAPATQTFAVEAASTPLTLVFTFEEGVEANHIRLTNPGGRIFEVERVVWKRLPPAIVGELQVPAFTLMGADFRCSLSNLSGGSERYVRADFAFRDATATLEAPLEGKAVTFVAPLEEGVYPVTATVWDDLGGCATLSADVQVRAYAPPRNLRASEITRTGFTVEWDIGPLSPTDYAVRATGVPATEPLSARVVPEWQADGDGRFTTAEPIDLARWTEGEAAEGFLSTPAWEGALEVSDDGTAWRPLLDLEGLWFTLTATADAKQPIWLRATADAPPAAVVLTLTVTHAFEQIVKAADGQRRAAVFTGLPAGRETWEVTVSARYPTASGNGLSVDSDPLAVTLEPIPPFREATWADGLLELVWPEGVEGLDAEMALYAEREVPHALPPGLYLTRTCFTSSKDAEGKASGFSAGKGIVLTNTTEADILLDGITYTFRSAKEGSAARNWDFYSVEDGVKCYPYVVPAGGELAFTHYAYPIPEVREGVRTVGVHAFNFTPEYALTLLKDGEPVNSLGCATNAVLRLEEDRLDAVTSHALRADDLDMSPFYEAWTRLSDTAFHRALSVPHPDGDGRLSLLSLAPEALVGDLTGVRRIWAEFSVLDGAARSKPLAVELWRREPAPASSRRGFRLRLR